MVSNMPNDHLSPEAAEAVHKAKNAAQAIEMAREAQAREQAEQNKQALVEALRVVFGDGDGARDPKEMRVLVQRIPILCTTILAMHDSIEKMESNQTWVVRLIIGGVIAAVMALVLK